MTKEKCIELLTRRAVQVEDANRLDKEAGGIFCGIPNSGEIFIFGPHFLKVIDALQPTVTFRPREDEFTDAEFTTELLGKRYRVYGLIKKGGKKG